MDHLAFFPYAQREIQARMKFSPGAFTSGLAADPVHGDQRPDEQGLLMEQFRQAGAGLAFLWGKVATVTHTDLLYSDIYKYIRIKDTSQAFFEREFAQITGGTQIAGIFAELCQEKI
jgi:hypothetical protein